MQQEMETDDDHATVRENFSLVQNILFVTTLTHSLFKVGKHDLTGLYYLPMYVASVYTGVFEIYVLECVRLKYIC